MRRLLWIFPDRSSARQKQLEEAAFWGPYRDAAQRVGLTLNHCPPEAVSVIAVDIRRPLVYVGSTLVDPADTVFVTELYTFSHQVGDAFNQVALFTVLEQLGFYLPIPPRLSYLGHDKLASLLYLRDSPVSAVPSVRLCAGRDTDYAQLAETVARLDFPVIVKPAGWAGGQGVCLAAGPEEVLAITSLAAGADCSLIVQPYLGPDTVDYRIYMVAGQPKAVLRRQPAKGTVAANAMRGGDTSLVPLPADLVPLAEYFAQRFPIPYFCVDFLHDGKRYWLSEVEMDGAIPTRVPGSAGGYLPWEETAPVLEARFAAYAAAHDRWLSARTDGLVATGEVPR